MSRQVSFHPQASEEYTEALLYYGERSEVVASRFEAAINSSLKQIAEDPSRYPIRLGLRRCMVIAFPYSIYYRENDLEIQIIAIAHQKRKPGYWLSRG
jgi:plasmid stabilization system protein ParE